MHGLWWCLHGVHELLHALGYSFVSSSCILGKECNARLCCFHLSELLPLLCSFSKSLAYAIFISCEASELSSNIASTVQPGETPLRKNVVSTLPLLPPSGLRLSSIYPHRIQILRKPSLQLCSHNLQPSLLEQPPKLLIRPRNTRIRLIINILPKLMI